MSSPLEPVNENEVVTPVETADKESDVSDLLNVNEDDEDILLGSDVDTDSDEEDSDEEDSEGEEDSDDDMVDIGSILVNALETEEGDTVCTALVGIRDQIAIHNKIMVKILKTIS